MRGHALPRPVRAGRRSLALAAAAGLVLLAAWTATPAAAQGPGAQRTAPNRHAQRAETRPLWDELTADQQRALQPLAPTWNTMSEGHKRKWIALSRNFRTMSPDEQAKLHSRMNEWVALSPQQRTQARLNFAETKGLSANDKKAKWEAYQALPPEEKRKLAARAASTRTPPTAAALKPVPPQKLAKVPAGDPKKKRARIAADPQAGSSNTPPASAPAQAR